MNDLRKKVARLIMIVVTVSVVYVLNQLGDPEYVPSIGWVGASFVGSLATWWAVQYAELPWFQIYED